MKVLYWLLAIALAAGLLYYSMRGVDWAQLGHNLANANLLLVAVVLALNFVGMFLRSIRWRLLLLAEGQVSVSTAFWATCTGYFGNLFLPARAGELIRTFMISAGTQLSKTYVLTTALSERLMDVVALVLWASLIVVGMEQKPNWNGRVAHTIAIVSLLGTVAIAMLQTTGE